MVGAHFCAGVVHKLAVDAPVHTPAVSVVHLSLYNYTSCMPHWLAWEINYSNLIGWVNVIGMQ